MDYQANYEKIAQIYRDQQNRATQDNAQLAQALYEELTRQLGAAEPGRPDAGSGSSGMNPDDYQAFVQSVQVQLSAGKRDAIMKSIESQWDGLSGAQRQGIWNLLAWYGYGGLL